MCITNCCICKHNVTITNNNNSLLRFITDHTTNLRPYVLTVEVWSWESVVGGGIL
jgi:hypothetical protein